MIITLPRGIKVDTENIRPDLAEIVSREFGKYTTGTSEAYTYQDKLCFIDLMTEKLHDADSSEKVRRYIKDTFNRRLDEYGEIADESEFLTIEFMETCYDIGQEDHRLYSTKFTEDWHTNEKIMQIEMIVIKAVMDWKKERE